jgi:hypothetical protein
MFIMKLSCHAGYNVLVEGLAVVTFDVPEIKRQMEFFRDASGRGAK